MSTKKQPVSFGDVAANLDGLPTAAQLKKTIGNKEVMASKVERYESSLDTQTSRDTNIQESKHLDVQISEHQDVQKQAKISKKKIGRRTGNERREGYRYRYPLTIQRELMGKVILRCDIEGRDTSLVIQSLLEGWMKDWKLP